MTAQFHAGQEVEITDSRYPLSTFSWRKAKIVRHSWDHPGYRYEVQFPAGTRAVVDAAHIRAVEKPLKVGFDEIGSMVIE